MILTVFTNQLLYIQKINGSNTPGAESCFVTASSSELQGKCFRDAGRRLAGTDGNDPLEMPATIHSSLPVFTASVQAGKTLHGFFKSVHERAETSCMYFSVQVDQDRWALCSCCGAEVRRRIRSWFHFRFNWSVVEQFSHSGPDINVALTLHVHLTSTYIYIYIPSFSNISAMTQNNTRSDVHERRITAPQKQEAKLEVFYCLCFSHR